MNKKVYDPDGDGKFDSDEIHVAGVKSLVANLATLERIFVPIQYFVVATQHELVNRHTYWRLNAVGERVYANFAIPKKYDSLGKLYLMFFNTSAGAGNRICTFYNELKSPGEAAATTDTATDTILTANNDTNLVICDSGLDFSTAAPDDFCGLEATYKCALDIDVLGFVFEYKKKK